MPTPLSSVSESDCQEGNNEKGDHDTVRHAANIAATVSVSPG